MGLEKIEYFKKERGLTNEELATLSGVPKTTIDKITAGTTKDPKLETIRAIVHSLGHTLDDLNDPPISNGVTIAENTMLQKYRILDHHGQSAVEAILNIEHDRVQAAIIAHPGISADIVMMPFFNSASTYTEKDVDVLPDAPDEDAIPELLAGPSGKISDAELAAFALSVINQHERKEAKKKKKAARDGPSSIA